MTYTIETFELSKEFFPTKSLYRFILHPFKKEKPLLALNNITIQVRPGEIFCLIGPNGAGKTTLIKLLSCLILPTKGGAKVAGHDILKEEENVKALIGLISGDERSFYWRLTLRQNLEFFAALYDLSRRQAKSRIEELSSLLEIDQELDQRFQECSTGIKQRLSIARSLLNNPQVLFIDELMKNLDPTSSKDLRKFIKETLVEKQRKTIFFSTHQLYGIETLADRIAFMSKGRIIAEGTFDELKKMVGNQDTTIEQIYDYFINK